MKKSTIRLGAYALILGALGIGSMTFFNIAQYNKAKYKASSAKLQDTVSKLTNIYNQNPNALTDTSDVKNHDAALWYNDIYETMYVVNEQNKDIYVGTAIPAYLLSTLTLVGFGLILKYEEKEKDKEDNTVAR